MLLGCPHNATCPGGQRASDGAQAGRLQTQHIMLSSAAPPGVEMWLKDVPPVVQLERPLAAAVSMRNNLDRRLGPLQLSYSALASGG